MTTIPPLPIPPPGVFVPEGPALLPPDFELVGSIDGWREGWSAIVSGNFSNSPFSCLLCYEAGSGVAAFYELDDTGRPQLLQEFTDWRTTWTHIVPGVFGNSGYDGFLLYDADAGLARFYDTDGQGNLIKLREYHGWQTTWTEIVVAPFTDSKYSGFLLYDQSAGIGVFYRTDGHGGYTLLREFDDWRTTWTTIVPGLFSAKSSDAIFADLFFYEGSTGYGETYATDGKGGINMLSGQGGFPPTTDVLGGNFGCMGNFQEWTNLLFFNRPTNVGTIFAFSVYSDGTQDTGSWKPVEMIRPQALDPVVSAKPMLERSLVVGPIIPLRPWGLVGTGNFWMVDQNDEYFGTNGKYPQYHLLFNGGCTDLLFYDRDSGTIQFYLKETAQTTPLEPLCGYASARSVLPGEVIQFHISSQVGAYRIDVYRQGIDLVYMANVPVNLGPARAYGISRRAFEDGAQWPAAASLTIPSTWPSGLYLARVQSSEVIAPGGGAAEAPAVSSGDEAPPFTPARSGIGALARRFGLPDQVTYDIPFVVRPAWPGAQARIIVAAADTTYEAYNYWGGRSLYGHGCSGLDAAGTPGAVGHIWSAPYGLLQPRALEVSFLRPFATAVVPPVSRMKTFEIPLIQWLERNGFPFDMCAASDLQRFPDLLSNYRLFVSVGHDEYWSQEMRDNVEGFVADGGNAAFLSGNTCWWAVSFTLDGDKMICCKDKILDPDTVTWNDLHHSAMSMVGTDNYMVWSNVPPEQPFPGQYFVVNDDAHWAFEGTGLSNDDTFGVYLRPDGTFICAVGGESNNDGKTGILATATFIDTTDHNRVYHGTMVSFQKGKHEKGDPFSGTVLNAASINWVTALSQQPGLWNSADQITWNVFSRLG